MIHSVLSTRRRKSFSFSISGHFACTRDFETITLTLGETGDGETLGTALRSQFRANSAMLDRVQKPDAKSTIDG